MKTLPLTPQLKLCRFEYNLRSFLHVSSNGKDQGPLEELLEEPQRSNTNADLWRRPDRAYRRGADPKDLTAGREGRRGRRVDHLEV